jgi:peptidoglycan/LPS O-acetylase OafA/YrhL
LGLGQLERGLFFPFSQSVEGVFDGLPGSDAINGSLWTLKYEVACYAFGTMLISTGKFRIAVVTACWLGAMVATRILGDPLEQSGATYYIAWMVWLFRFYGAGMLLYLLRDRIPLSIAPAMASLAVVIGSAFTPFFTESLATFGAYALIASAFLAARWFKDLTASGDLSYGVYIYAFPVQQALVPISLETSIPWLTNVLLATPVTFLLAALSWRFVERPALNLKARLQRKPATANA